jgi:Flp pilus assembly protein TadG
VSAVDRGSAVAETVMVTALLLVLFLGVLQVGFALHVRSTLAAAAADGARYGAAAGRSDADAARRAKEIAEDALAPSLVGAVDAGYGEVDGAPTVVVQLTGRLPVLGPWGPSSQVRVRGRALREGAS